MKARIESLQVVRFIAASLVIALHSWQAAAGDVAPRPLAALGPMGVDLFFVLSGYIMATVAAGASAGEFLARRAVRVLPLYWVLTAAFMAELALAGALTAGPALSSLLMFPAPGVKPYLNVAWTLDYEMLFYLGFAGVLVLGRRGPPVVLGAFALAMGLRLAAGGPFLDFVGNPIILEFLAGVAVARAPASRRGGILALGGGLAMICAIAALRDGVEGWDRPLVMTLPCSLVIYGAAQFSGSGRAWRGMVLLGDASYSAYLVHQFPLSIAKAGRGLLPALPEAAALIALCWGVALVVYRALEQPLLQRLRRPRLAPAGAGA